MNDFQWVITFAVIGVLIFVLITMNKVLNHKLNKSKTPIENSNEQIECDTEIKDTDIPEAKKEVFPYKLTNTIFSKKETYFHNSLKPIAEKLSLNIMSKMRLADIVYIPKSTPNYIRWFNYIKAKHIDFILCDKDYKIVLLIEVDDYTHDYDNRKKRDEFVDEIFRQLDLPILHIRTWKDQELFEEIKALITKE